MAAATWPTSPRFNSEQDIYYVRVSPAAAARSFFAIRSIKRNASGATITFPTEPGKIYRVEYSDRPGEPWQELRAHVDGTGADIPISDPDAVGRSARFYRIVVLP